ncbi:MAG: hypothetical protein HY317_03565 [Acidobacteria bacterium]|nr:hypothetical protein [Acidobacteriota bacterium]
MNATPLRTLATLALGAGLAAPLAAQTNFTTYIVVGDSLAAGYSSGSLVETQQVLSVPALVARQAAAPDFQQPLVAEPGIPPQLSLVSLVPAPVIAPKASTPGAPKNAGLARPYNNLAVPGATALDALTRVTDAGGFHDLILRGRGSQVAQAAGSRPTFVLLWIGNNDVLGAAIRGKAVDGVTLTPTAAFGQVYGQIVTTLKGTGAFVVAANLPDVTSIPYVTTIRPYVVNPSTGQPVLVNGQTVPLLGPDGPLPPGSYVTLPASSLLAQGTGIPKDLGGSGKPLPDEVVLDAGEVAVIRDHVTKNNQAIRDLCQQAGIPVLDVHALLEELATGGRDLGGVQLTSAFLTGGIFGYDGVHPSSLGYAVVANEWIRVINENGGSLPVLDLAPFVGLAAGGAARRSTPSFEFTPEALASLLTAFPTVDGR